MAVEHVSEQEMLNKEVFANALPAHEQKRRGRKFAILTSFSLLSIASVVLIAFRPEIQGSVVAITGQLALLCSAYMGANIASKYVKK